MDCGRTFLVALLATYGVAASAAEPQPREKGWMAHNMSGNCEMARGGLNLDAADTTHGLLVQAIGNPRERPDRGQVMMNIAFFVANKMAENSEVVSFSVLDGAADSAARLTVKPPTAVGLSLMLDQKAEDALSLFATERLVRVEKKDGSVAMFRFPVKGFATSKAMFETCVRESRKHTD